MSNIAFTILGTPIGFDCTSESRSRHFIQYYDGSTTPKKFVVARQKNSVDYVYLKYGLISSQGREGSFIGLALSIDEAYCSDPLQIADLLESIYQDLIKRGVLTQKTTSTGKTVIQYSKEYGEFSKLSSYVEQLTPWLKETLEKDFKGTIFPLDSTFQGKENAHLMPILPWDNSSTEKVILDKMREYPFLSFIPGGKIVPPPPIIRPEDRDWLENYGKKIKDTLREREFVALYDHRKSVETLHENYDRLQVTFQKEKHIEELERLLCEFEGLSENVERFHSSIGGDKKRIERLEEILIKSSGGENSLVSSAIKVHKEYEEACKNFRNFIDNDEKVVKELLAFYKGPKPDPDPKEKFFELVWTWITSHKKSVMYMLFFLVFAGLGVYTYSQFFPQKNQLGELAVGFEEEKEKIEAFIREDDFSSAKASLDKLQGDSLYKKHFEKQIDSLINHFKSSAIVYYENNLIEKNEPLIISLKYWVPKNGVDKTKVNYYLDVKEKIETIRKDLKLDVKPLFDGLQNKVDTHFQTLCNDIIEDRDSTFYSADDRKKEMEKLIKQGDSLNFAASIKEKAEEFVRKMNEEIKNSKQKGVQNNDRRGKQSAPKKKTEKRFPKIL